MTYKHLLSLFIILSVVGSVFSQAYTIDWKTPQKQLIGDTERISLCFDGAVYEENPCGLPEFYINISDVYATDATIVNAKYVPLDEFERKLIPNIAFPEKTINSTPSYNDFEKTTYIKVFPFRKNEDGSIEKLISFDLKLIAEKRNTAARTSSTQAVASSVLASGDWYKIQITEDGFYKIDKSMLESMGINTGSIDPRKIKLYGSGGGMLPQKNADFRYDDLQENAIWVFGEEDGAFNNSDYILFYGKSQHVIIPSNEPTKLTHIRNIFADASYYFLHISSDNGKRINTVSYNNPAEETFDYYDHYAYHESDSRNLIISGREWVGEEFSFNNRSVTLNFATNGIYPGETLTSNSLIYNITTQPVSLKISLDGVVDSTLSISAATSESYGRKATDGRKLIPIRDNQIIGNSLSIRYEYNPGGNTNAKSYLDKTWIQYKRILSPYGNQTFFQTLASTSVMHCGYSIQNFNSNYFLFDVSSSIDIKNINYSLQNNTATFTYPSFPLKTFAIIHKNQGFLSPEFVEKVSNQNLHADVSSVPELIIITHPTLEEKANEYAQMKRETIGISVLVTNTNVIYNEFSSGAQDITAIRDYIRMLYQANPTKLKYVLLFGDASYDFKNRVPYNTNLIPTFQAPESFHNVSTYASDDFFGFMDENEGEWVTSNDHLLNLSVGRFPINTTAEADILIRKVRTYTSSETSMGKWRNQIIFAADDDDNSLHMFQADQLAEYVEATYKNYNPNKIYLDAFEQLSTPSGEVSPLCTEKLTEKIEKGALIVNYTGHGSEIQWGKENIIATTDIKKLRNFDKLSLFVTATCEFGRYDDPKAKSGAEELLLNPAGGAIALLTTTRPVYAQSNFTLNTKFYEEAFEQGRTLGDVMKETKNKSIQGTRNRNFTLLGDPSMTLSYPKKEIVVTAIAVEGETGDTIKALGLTTISGEVLNASGSVDNSFEGEVTVTVYDKKSRIRTLGDEGPYFQFDSRENLLYEGKASVTNGKFTTSFIVPKDISYQFDKGKISMYAKSTENKLLDAGGGNIDVIIGGTASLISKDETAPKIELYMNNFSFRSGDAVSSSPLFLAKIFDENGINISTAGLGHEIVATLDGDESKSFILNEFYTSDLDNYKSGLVEYPLKNLVEGEHTISLRAWDTHNNVGSASIRFMVDYAQASLYSYPNPMSELTNFVIEHSRQGADLTVELDILQPDGKEAYHKELAISNSNSVIEGLSWDGRNDYGIKLNAGVYFCRALLRYDDGKTVIAKVQRLVLID